MAYGSSNPPNLVWSFGGKPQIWTYQSTHTAAEAAASGFIANGYDLGMKKGDMVLQNQSTDDTSTIMFVSAVTASSAATLTAVTTST